VSNIAATAIVSPKAELAADVTVGAYAVIGDNVQIGAGTWVGSASVILSDVGRNCVIGNRPASAETPVRLAFAG